MPLTSVVEARADTVMSQVQTIFAALFALLRRLGPMVLNAILLLNINTLAVPVAAALLSERGFPKERHYGYTADRQLE